MTVDTIEPTGRHCAVTITFDEVGDRTRAVARMNWRNRQVVGVGYTRPGELLPGRAAERRSLSRALSDLAARLDDGTTDGGTGRDGVETSTSVAG